METKKGLFYENWTKSEDEFSEEEMNLKSDELKMTFEKDFDSARKGIIDSKRKVSEMLKNKLKSFCLDDFRQAEQDVKDFETAKKEVAEVYARFFGEKIKRD